MLDRRCPQVVTVAVILWDMNVLDWLLDGDPVIRFQTLRDLTDASPWEIATERRRIAHEGWGARLLDLQGDDGHWDGGACFPGHLDWSAWDWEGKGQPWTATLPVLQLLHEFGIDPADARVQDAIAQVHAKCRWEYANEPFFEGEVEPCINARAATIGLYFGQPVEPIIQRLLGEQMADGGWNCDQEKGSVRSSFHSTICVLETLREVEQASGHQLAESAEAIATARERAETYLLDRQLLRRRSTGEYVNPNWLEIAYPVHWYYDLLRVLDYFQSRQVAPDPRMDEAIALLRAKQQPDGRFLLERTHFGPMWFPLDEDGVGHPSRWNTLRALRVLKWADQTRPS